MKTKSAVQIVATVIAVLLFSAISANAAILKSQLGLLDLSANGGLNPATGAAWQLGDQYRLVFISSTPVDPQNSAADDIAYWNAAVQSIANNSTIAGLGSVTWNIIGSTETVDARDNTSTNPNVNGTGHTIFNLDGSTVIENNFDDLWDGNAPLSICLYDENGVDKDASTAVDWPLTGTSTDGTANGTVYLQDTSSSGSIRQGRNQIGFEAGWIDANNIGANWSADGALSVYGMSEALTIIPEPSTALLAGLGLAGLVLRRRRGK